MQCDIFNHWEMRVFKNAQTLSGGREWRNSWSIFNVLISSQLFPQTDIHSCLRAVCTYIRTTQRSMGKHVTHTHMHTHSPSSFPWILTYWAQTSGIYTLQIWRVEGDTHRLAHKQDQTQSRQMARGQIQRGPLRDAQELRWQQRCGEGVRREEEQGEGEDEEEEEREKEEEDEKSSSGLYPRRSLKSMQPKENQSALLSYAVPFWRTSGAM